jgi:hypothetical protein
LKWLLNDSNAVIKKYRAKKVTIAFTNKTIDSSVVRFYPIIPEPTTAQNKKAVPKNSEIYFFILYLSS